MPPRNTGPKGRTKPQVDAVFALDTQQGYSAYVRAKSVAEVAEVLLKARDEGGFAVYTRADGEDIIVNPEMVYLIGKVSPPPEEQT